MDTMRGGGGGKTRKRRQRRRKKKNKEEEEDDDDTRANIHFFHKHAFGLLVALFGLFGVSSGH